MRRFLIVGQTGVGKSSFINAVFGLPRAEISDFEACTKVVEHYIYKSPFGEVCLIDTPGLSEDSLEVDSSYLKMVRRSIESDGVNITLYVSPLNEKRFRPSEKSALNLLTQELGKSIWANAWLILTFAASIPSERLDQTCDVRINQIDSYIREIAARKKKKKKKFEGFKKIALIDNIVPNWTSNARPIDEIFE